MCPHIMHPPMPVVANGFGRCFNNTTALSHMQTHWEGNKITNMFSITILLKLTYILFWKQANRVKFLSFSSNRDVIFYPTKLCMKFFWKKNITVVFKYFVITKNTFSNNNTTARDKEDIALKKHQKFHGQSHMFPACSNCGKKSNWLVF